MSKNPAAEKDFRLTSPQHRTKSRLPRLSDTLLVCVQQLCIRYYASHADDQ